MSRSALHLEIEATNRCNIRCLHCPHERITRPTGMLDWPTFEAIVANVRAHVGEARFSVSFSGMGEPLLNPLLPRFIAHVAAHATTGFSTNALLLNAKTIEGLIDAGLDSLYISFPSDDPDLHSEMMGGASFTKSVGNLRLAVEMTRGTRTRVLANLVLTKRNRDKAGATKRFLEAQGLGPVTVSLAHSRGGNLNDPSVCDTPPMPAGSWACDVLKHTLFVDWRGLAFVCDHDLHGEHGYGDVAREPMTVILQRRDEMLARHQTFPLCQGCNDVMRIGDAPLLESGNGGSFRDWVSALFEPQNQTFDHAGEPLRWIARIARHEGKTDALLAYLLHVEAEGQRDAAAQIECLRQAGIERDHLQNVVNARDAELAELHAKYRAVRRSLGWRISNALSNDWHRLRRWVTKRRSAPALDHSVSESPSPDPSQPRR